MDFSPVSFLDSPPYKPDDDDEDLLITSENTLGGVWDSFSILTPPLTPVDITSHDNEIMKHLSNHESRSITEHYIARDLQTSPAILNDIMWNSGQKHKRPDSSMDIDVRFNLCGTPISFDQPIANTFVETSELFSFSSLLENCSDPQEAESRHSVAMDSDSGKLQNIFLFIIK